MLSLLPFMTTVWRPKSSHSRVAREMMARLMPGLAAGGEPMGRPAQLPRFDLVSKEPAQAAKISPKVSVRMSLDQGASTECVSIDGAPSADSANLLSEGRWGIPSAPERC
jgi:hypothetical protein